MPHLVRVYIRQVIVGFILSAVFVAMLMTANVANLWHLVTHTDGGFIAVLMLWIFNGIVFAGVQFALALPSERQDDAGGRGDAVLEALAEPVPVRIARDIPNRPF